MQTHSEASRAFTSRRSLARDRQPDALRTELGANTADVRQSLSVRAGIGGGGACSSSSAGRTRSHTLIRSFSQQRQQQQHTRAVRRTKCLITSSHSQALLSLGGLLPSADRLLARSVISYLFYRCTRRCRARELATIAACSLLRCRLRARCRSLGSCAACSRSRRPSGCSSA